jgi:hypothetical protein
MVEVLPSRFRATSDPISFVRFCSLDEAQAESRFRYIQPRFHFIASRLRLLPLKPKARRGELKSKPANHHCHSEHSEESSFCRASIAKCIALNARFFIRRIT